MRLRHPKDLLYIKNLKMKTSKSAKDQGSLEVTLSVGDSAQEAVIANCVHEPGFIFRYAIDKNNCLILFQSSKTSSVMYPFLL